MRNPDLPKLLRDMKRTANALEEGRGDRSCYEQAAIELEKLEKIYNLPISKSSHDVEAILYGDK